MDFTFAINKTPKHDELKPLYDVILGPDIAKPKVSLGAVSRAEAESWLVAQHARYVGDVGSRSGLLKKINLPDRVELVGLKEDAP